MHPITIPRIGLPPNRLQALYATANGKNPKIAPEEMLISRLIPNNVSFAFTISKFPSTPESPVSSAAASIPGIISTNTSDSALMTRCNGFIFLFATVFRSLRLIFFILLCSANTSYTSLTSPAPNIICTWSPATNTPFAKSTSSIAFKSARSLSFNTIRSLVAQCATPWIFSFPPTSFVSSMDIFSYL